MHNRKEPKQKAPEGCLWIEEAAPYIGVTLATLRKWRVEAKGPGRKGFPIGRYIAYRVEDLDAYLEAQYQAAVAPTPDAEHDSRPPEPRLTRAA
ncbi:helix-turn-helix domain-containing protein [Streptomyces sp. ActVer]|uniref:helix-turn-helix domain-containing protein n=1 Tax=Streptomyces sp. ActVer TaxID=3014558 RepID=UPI0022B49E03|nr:helix-turn-helix domain-containing protein [Streptomyces sp. ActVer]MCZ4509920.1 helix-turn-helix domain-containing protein [Streptomyces sp. ActVer]